LMGDEVRRTQRGNNNAYGQDNPLGWFDWGLTEQHADLHRFVRLLIDCRFGRKTTDAPTPNLQEILHRMVMQWHGTRLGQPDWSGHSHALAFSMMAPHRNARVYGLLNAYWEPLTFQLPAPDGSPWRRCLDTSLPSPHDISEWHEALEIRSDSYRAEARSVVILAAGLSAGNP
jgi:isoamylase